MEKKIKIGKYRHYKGKYYKVLNVARHSETWEGNNQIRIYRREEIKK